MIINELILQGIRRFKDPVKFQLQSGLNVFYGTNEKGKTTVSDALFSLFSLAQERGRSSGLRSPSSKDSRLGVTFKEGPDTFRLLMDVASDAVLLSKYNQERKKFDTVSKDAAEIRDFLVRDLLFKPLEQYRSLYLMDTYVLLGPSVQGTEQKGEDTVPFTLDGGAKDYIGQDAGSFDAIEPTSLTAGENMLRDNMTEEEIRSRIAKLEDELQSSSDAAAQQDRLDQLEAKLTDTQNKLAAIGTCALDVERAEKETKELSRFSDLPEDIEKKVDEYVQFEAKMKREIESIERQKSSYAGTDVAVPPFYKDTLFIAGGAVSVLFVVAPVAVTLLLGPWGVYLSAGIFAGLAMMGYALWKDAGKRSEIKKRQFAASSLEKQIKEQKKKYEIEGSVITSITASMGLESPSALKEGLKKYREALGQLESVRKKYSDLLAGSDVELLKKQEEQTKSEIDVVQEKLRAMTGSGMDQYSITQEIESLKKRLNNQEGGPVRQENGPPVRQKVQQGPKETDTISEPAFAKNLSAISDLAGDTRERIASLAMTKASSYLSLLTKGAFQEVSSAGNRIAVLESNGTEYTFSSLSGSMKEKCAFSIALSILGLAVEKWPWPVVLDEPFAVLDEANRQAVYTVIKSFSKETQVLMLTKDASIKPLADAFIAL
ncbi:MAG: hypothetical protein M1491_09055 [Deltaproteobacteria bacterium]|nr:hypothetical protein [Deltaproteobacteria bacterium]MCL5277320.1 hypothetical protein [Deltaproteobacteria bacterium]